MNILVTGATGFIGKNLTRELRKENNVYILGRYVGEPEQLGLSGFIMTEDIKKLSEYIKEKNIEGIVHLASLYLAVHKTENIKEMVLSNVYLGTAVLEAATDAGCVKWILNTGSIWQNYNVTGLEYNPVNLYAATKQAFIDIAQYYIDVFKIKFCTLKLSDTYGPNDTRRKIFNLFKEYSESGEVLKMSPGDQLIDVLYIDDVVSGFIHLIKLLSSKKQIENQYVLTSDQQIPLRQLANKFEEVSGKKLNIEWGGLPYRNREVMVPWKGPRLIGWEAKKTLEEGLKEYLFNRNEI